MFTYEFKTCITKEKALYYFIECESGNQQMRFREIEFPDSLLSFLHWDIEFMMREFRQLADGTRQVIETGDPAAWDDTYDLLQRLANYHIYFELLRLDWEHKFSQGRGEGQASLENTAFAACLEELPGRLAVLQRRGLSLIKNVLDTDSPKKPVDMKMTDYYLAAEQAGEDVFKFKPQQTCFELLHQKTFGEILSPDTTYDLIDYHLRECVRREIRMRVCKNCGKYFAVTGHGGTEYCSRAFDSKGRTCKEIGAVTQWAKSKSGDVVFKEYRREYKRRFAWIKSGRIDSEEFYAWSEEAREKKAECEAGKISFEEFSAWLGNS